MEARRSPWAPRSAERFTARSADKERQSGIPRFAQDTTSSLDASQYLPVSLYLRVNKLPKNSGLREDATIEQPFFVFFVC
jgi:hypothetical protein